MAGWGHNLFSRLLGALAQQATFVSTFLCARGDCYIRVLLKEIFAVAGYDKPTLERNRIRQMLTAFFKVRVIQCYFVNGCNTPPPFFALFVKVY